MKRCPQCNRVETDQALKFCRVDGATLVNDSSSITEPDTAQLGAQADNEVHTSIFPHNTQANVDRATGPTTSLPQAAAGVTREFSKARPNKTLIAAIIGVVIVALGIGAFLLARRLTASKSEHGIESVAVLPFENATGKSESEYLSDGLAESLIYRLSQVPNLKVTPRSSVFRYKGKAMDAEKIGEELGVDAVMSGRLIQRGDDLIISVDLIDIKNKKTLWGDQFQRKMSDLLATQQDITAAIADKLRVRFSGNDPKGIAKQYTTNNEAYQLYLQGRYFWNKRNSENLTKAAELLRAATEKDPNFALAYAGLADCYAVSYYYIGERPREMMPLAKTYAAKAIELDPTLAEPHATLGLVDWLLDRDRATAQKEHLRAIELNPNYPTAHHWYSRYLRAIGRLDDAWPEIKKAEELDSLSQIIINNVAEIEIDRHELDAAARDCQRAIDLDSNFWAAHQTLGIVRVKQGRYDDALAEAQKSVQLTNRWNASLALLGHVYAKLGRRSDAEAVIKELEKRYAEQSADGRDLAIVYAGLDDKDKAFSWLDKAVADRSVILGFMKLEPLLETLRSDPRWNDLEHRAGVS